MYSSLLVCLVLSNVYQFVCKMCTHIHIVNVHIIVEARRSVLGRGASPFKPMTSPSPGVLSPSSESSGISSRKSSSDNLLALDGLYPTPDHCIQFSYFPLLCLTCYNSYAEQYLRTKMESLLFFFLTTFSFMLHSKLFLTLILVRNEQ